MCLSVDTAVKRTLGNYGLGAGAHIKKPLLLENIGVVVKEELEKWAGRRFQISD
jgi:hypothetical protein